MSEYPIVTRAYPPEYWEAYGDELLDTANEMHDDKWSFRESRTLLVHGLRTRSLAATGGSIEQMFVQGAVLYLWLSLAIGLVSNVTIELNLHGNFFSTPDYWRLGIDSALSVLVLFALTRSTRPFVMLISIAMQLGIFLSPDVLPVSRWFLVLVPVLIATFVAARGDGRPVMLTRTGALFLVLGTIALVVSLNASLFILLGMAAAGFVLVAIDPRALVCMALWFLEAVIVQLAFSAFGHDDWWVLLLVATAAVVALGAATVGQRRVNRF